MLRKFFRRKDETGFTVTELLITAVILIMLAAIAVPIFTSQRAKMHDNELKADLINASANLEEAKVDNGGKYPTTLPSNVKLATAESTLRYTYPYDKLDYCLQLINGDKTFFKTNKSAEVTETDCTYEFVLPSTKLTGSMKNTKPVLSWNTVANATKYTIYKNNIPVQTVNASTTSAKTQSYTLPDMLPSETATFHIIVGDGGTQSAQSNTVRLTAPVPAPTKPEIKILSQNVKDSTTMEFTLGWNAVKYAKSYEIYDVTGSTPTKLATLSQNAGTYTYSSPRGTTRKVMARSVNDTGASGDSNTLEISTEWPTPKILSGESNVSTGKIDFKFATEKNGVISPDYGYPDSRIQLKVTEISTGKLVYDKSGISSMEHTTDVSFNRIPHRATIIVTTSTGETLSESAPIEINFPKPTKPSAVENFTSTNGGESTITPNRLKWSAVECSVSATPQYQITHDSFNSSWIESTSFNIPSEWLAEGSSETFSIVARCSNANGTSSSSEAVTTTFTTGLSTPSVPTELTVADRGSKASWKAVSCVAGSTAEYSIKQSIRNSDNQAFAFSPIKTNTYTIPNLTGGTDQNFAVAARCVQYDGANNVKASSSWSAFTGFYNWTTKFQAPSTPIIKEDRKEYSTTTNAQFRVVWNNDPWAMSYEVFSITKNAQGIEQINSLGTFDGGAKEAIVNVKRGESLKIYAVASNPDHTSSKSNVLTLTDAWEKPKLIDYIADPYSGTLEVTWATVDEQGNNTPNWGDPDARYEISTKDTVSGAERTFNELEGSTLLIPDEFVGRNPQIVTLIVTTSTGKILTSDPITVEFPLPGPPKAPANVTITSSPEAGDVTPNRLTWTAVSCGRATPEYLITNPNGEDSGWVEASQMGTTDTFFYDLPEAWLKQGFDTSVSIQARCANPAGVSPSSDAVSVKFRVNINTPEKVSSYANDGIDTLSWEHSTAPTGLSREYKLTTTTFNGVTSTQSFITDTDVFVLQNLQPNKKQVVNLQVRFFNPANNASSAWSPVVSTTWVTPKPVPGTPVIKLVSSNVLNSTTQRYVISWGATSWAETYRVVDSASGDILATVTGTTANIDLKRGIDPVEIYVEAMNTSAISPESNALELSAPWSDAEILDTVANRDGTAKITWQTGTLASPTPDWGTPDSTVAIEIRRGSSTGPVVYSANGLKTLDHTTTSFANTSTLRGSTYYVKITVKTSTGVSIPSGWNAFKFERPQAPARTVVNSDGLGAGTVKNNRLTWNAVTCTQENTRPEYWVSMVPVGKTYGNSSSTERVNLTGWKPDMTSYEIPQQYLVDVQGETVAFVVMTSCKFIDNGDYSYLDGIANGDGYHEFTVGLAPPTKNPGTPTRASVYNDTIKWTAATCGLGTTPEYRVQHAVRNGVSSTATYTTEDITYDLDSVVTAGANQGVKVQARCVKDTDATKVSAWGPYSAQYDYRSPLPKPGAPTITASGIVYTSATMAQRTVSWSEVDNAETYVVYDGTTVLATLNASTRTYNVPLTRGSTPARNITVKAGNFTYPVSTTVASNKITMNAPWPNAVVKSATADQARKVTVTWQTGAGATRSPNWGNDSSKVAVYITDTTTGAVVHSKTGILTNNYVSTAIAGTNQKYSAYIVVTTANGETLTSPKVNFVMNPPAAPKAVTNFAVSTDSTKPINNNRLTWTAVTCPTAGSTPEYFIDHIDEDFGNYDSGWVTGTTYNIPQAWLDEGRVQTYTIVARCTSAAGDSDASPEVSLTSPRTNVVTPDAATNFTVDSNKNNGTAIVSWDAITCPAHLQAGYLVVYSKLNDVSYASYSASNSAGALKHAYTNTSVTLTGLTQNKSHTAYVISRCYDSANTSITSTWANGNPSNSQSWKTPVPAPAAPTVTVSNIKTNPSNEAQTQATLTWTAPTWATKYYVYTSTGTLVGTYTGTSTTVYQTRGTSVAYYVIAENVQGIKGAKSANASVASSWPELVLTETGFNTSSGVWNAKWGVGTQNPDWGSTATFTYKITNSSGTVVTNVTGLASSVVSRSYDLPNSAESYDMVVTVKTVTGKVLTSNTLTREYVTPPAVPTGLKTQSHNQITWNAVTCYGDSSPSYWISWKRNGSTTASSFATTATTYTGAITPNTPQEVQVRAKCVSTSFGDSNWSSYTPVLSFTSEYPIPTSVPAPTDVKLTNAGPNNKTIHDRLQWTHISCPTGSTRTYTVEWTHKHGEFFSGSPFYTKSGITGNYYDLTSAQQQAGSKNSWRVYATCSVNLGSKNSGYTYTGWTRTPVNAPKGSVDINNNGWATVTWNPNMTCEAGTQQNFQFRVLWKNGVNVTDYWEDLKNSPSDASVSMWTQWGGVYGMKQSVYVQISCSFTNVDGDMTRSSGVNSTTMTWTPKVGAPTLSFKGSRTGKYVDITVTCPRGTDFRYWWTVSKEDDSGYLNSAVETNSTATRDGNATTIRRTWTYSNANWFNMDSICISQDKLVESSAVHSDYKLP